MFSYDKEDIQVAREILYDTEFWEYVNDKLTHCIETGYDYERIDKSFSNVLNVLLGILEKGALKDSIIKVNKSLSTLKKVDAKFNKEMQTLE